MPKSLYFIRKIKALFERFKLHILIGPFEGFLFNLLYLSKLSRWISENKSPGFNDFYNSKINYHDREKMYGYLLKNEGLDSDINYLEFGVAEGRAIKWWAKHINNDDARFYGFDTFTGLPEDFGILKKNFYDTGGKFPDIDDERVKFVRGLFQESLPEFLNSFEDDKRKLIHLDADLYSSTIFVMAAFAPMLRRGDVIIFDEFGVPTHEFRAFIDFFSSFTIEYELLAACNNYLQIAIKIA